MVATNSAIFFINTNALAVKFENKICNLKVIQSMKTQVLQVVFRTQCYQKFKNLITSIRPRNIYIEVLQVGQSLENFKVR